MQNLHRNTRMVVAAALGAAAITAAPAVARAAQVWVAPATTKVRPSAAVPSGAPTSATLAAAKNEFESFHVVVSGAASAVTMSASALSDGAGRSIATGNVTLYREALLNVATPSGGDGASGLWPDALVPDVDPIVGEKRNAFPFSVAAGQSIAVLVDLHVPANATAGVYRGTVSVSGGVTATIPVQLTVWDFAIPSTSSLRSAFGLSWNGPCTGHWNDGGCASGNSWALRQRYLTAALDNRISVDTPTMSAPVNTAGTQSWTDFDTHVGPFLDGTAPTRLAGARLTSVRMQMASGTPTTATVKAWSAHFRSKGWFNSLFNYVCDEPPLQCNWAEIDARITLAKAGDAAIPNIVTTSAQRAASNGVKKIDLFAPVVNWMDDKTTGTYPGNQRGQYGGTVWWYQSCMSFGCGGVGDVYSGSAQYETGWPSYAIDTDGSRNRAMEWMAFAYGVSGEIYYETTMAYFNGDAWSNQYAFGGTGDGTLFYPGTPAKIGGHTDIPVESLRLKGIRDGMEDYELLAMAKSLGAGEQAIQVAKGVFPKTYQAVATPGAIQQGRAVLAGLILHALGKDVPATTAPDGGTGTGGGSVPPSDPTSGSDGGTSPGDTGGGSTTSGGTAAGGGESGDIASGSADAGGETRTQQQQTTLLGPSGCASAGPNSVWMAIPVALLMLTLLRRRRQKA